MCTRRVRWVEWGSEGRLAVEKGEGKEEEEGGWGENKRSKRKTDIQWHGYVESSASSCCLPPSKGSSLFPFLLSLSLLLSLLFLYFFFFFFTPTPLSLPFLSSSLHSSPSSHSTRALSISFLITLIPLFVRFRVPRLFVITITIVHHVKYSPSGRGLIC